VTDHGLDFGPPKNKASRRCVPLSKTAAAALRAYRTRQYEERLRLGELWQDHDLVFPNRVGKPMDHGNLYDREYKPLLDKAGLGGKGFTFHSLRHTFATELFNQRKRPKIIQSMLGHSSITQTMDTYSHLLGDVNDGLEPATFGATNLVRLFRPVLVCPHASVESACLQAFHGLEGDGLSAAYGRVLVRLQYGCSSCS
jgi:Phage integrase family